MGWYPLQISKQSTTRLQHMIAPQYYAGIFAFRLLQLILDLASLLSLLVPSGGQVRATFLAKNHAIRQ